MGNEAWSEAAWCLAGSPPQASSDRTSFPSTAMKRWTRDAHQLDCAWLATNTPSSSSSEQERTGEGAPPRAGRDSPQGRSWARRGRSDAIRVAFSWRETAGGRRQGDLVLPGAGGKAADPAIISPVGLALAARRRRIPDSAAKRGGFCFAPHSGPEREARRASWEREPNLWRAVVVVTTWQGMAVGIPSLRIKLQRARVSVGAFSCSWSHAVVRQPVPAVGARF